MSHCLLCGSHLRLSSSIALGVSESTALPCCRMNHTKRSDWLERPRPTCMDLQNTAASAGLVLEAAHPLSPSCLTGFQQSSCCSRLCFPNRPAWTSAQSPLLLSPLPHPCHASTRSSAQTQPFLALPCHRQFNRGQHDKENTGKRPEKPYGAIKQSRLADS